LYRIPRNGGEPVALTSIATGVSGITPTSPALSVARDTGLTAYTVFNAGSYEIRLLEEPAATISPVTPPLGDLALLPPATREPSVVAAQLEDATRGLPSAQSTMVDPAAVTRGLSLIGIGQSLGASTGGPFGTYVNGGISMLFSDVLGNHLVPVSFGIDGGVEDLAGQVGYINRRHRWNWGLFAEHVPLRSGFVTAG